MEEVRAAERRPCVDRAIDGRAMRSLRVPPEKRTKGDVRNIVAEVPTSPSAYSFRTSSLAVHKVDEKECFHTPSNDNVLRTPRGRVFERLLEVRRMNLG